MFDPTLTERERRRNKYREYAKKGAEKYVSRGSCRACGGDKERQDRQHCNKCIEKRRGQNKARYDENIADGVCARCGGIREEKEFRDCRECRDRRRGRVLGRLYGITDEEYEELAAQQGWACWICGEKAGKGPGKKLHVDHNHKTGKVRGLLCSSCNGGLGSLHDSMELLKRAIEYLQEFDT